MRFLILSFLLVVCVCVKGQVLDECAFKSYTDNVVVLKNGELCPEETLKKLYSSGEYEINEDGSITREFDFPVKSKAKDELYDIALYVYRTFLYSTVPNRIVFDCESGVHEEKESDILYINKEAGVISFSFRSPGFRGSVMGMPSFAFSSKSTISWIVKDENIHVIEDISMLNIDFRMNSTKSRFTPSEVTPFGRWGSKFIGRRTDVPAIEYGTSRAILSCYIVDQMVLSKVLTESLLNSKYTQLIDNFRFFVSQTGDFLTKEGRNYIVINFDGKTSREIYNAFKKAVTIIYKSPKDVISFVEDEVISINAFAQRDFYWKENLGVSLQYVIKFQFKDGKVRIDAPTITELEISKADESPTFKWTMKLLNTFVNGESFQIEIINDLNKTINNIIDENVNMAEKIMFPNDDDDW